MYWKCIGIGDPQFFPEGALRTIIVRNGVVGEFRTITVRDGGRWRNTRLRCGTLEGACDYGAERRDEAYLHMLETV